MGLETDNHRLAAYLGRFPSQMAYHASVPEMHPVETPYRDHRVVGGDISYAVMDLQFLLTDLIATKVTHSDIITNFAGENLNLQACKK